MEKYLLVKACAGIGNRLYTVTRALEIAKLQERKLVVDWSDGQFAPKGVNAFNQFFDIVDFSNDSIVPMSKELSVYPKAWKNELSSAIYDEFYVVEPPYAFLKRLPLFILPGVKLKMLHGYWINKSVRATNNFFGFVKNIFNHHAFPYGEYYYKNRTEDILVYAEFSPPFKEELFLKYIKLKANYLKGAEQFCSVNELQSKSIGLHIRSTDKQPVKSFGFLLEYFAGKEFEQYTLFLATDNIEIEKAFKESFGTRLIVYPKFLPDTKGDGLHQYALYKNNEKVMLQITEESLMDLWILSMCEKLYYQGNSSFSGIAVILHANKENCVNWMSMN